MTTKHEPRLEHYHTTIDPKFHEKDRAIAVDRSLLVMPPMWRLFNFLPAMCDRSWGGVGLLLLVVERCKWRVVFLAKVCVCTFCHDLWSIQARNIYLKNSKVKDTNSSLVTPYGSFRKELLRQPYWHDYMCFALWPMFRAPVVTTTNLTSAIWILAAKKCMDFGFIIDLSFLLFWTTPEHLSPGLCFEGPCISLLSSLCNGI